MNTNIQYAANPIPWSMAFLSPLPVNLDHVTARHTFLGDETIDSKYCNKCGELKEFHQFYSREKNGNIYYNSICKICELAKRKDPEKAVEKKEKYKAVLKEREQSILLILSTGPMRVSAMMKSLNLRKTTLCLSLFEMQKKGLVKQIGKNVKTMWVCL